MDMRRTLWFAISIAVLGCAVRAAPAAQGDAAASPDAMPLDVTVTSDSARGWVPSEQLVGQAVDMIEGYYGALDAEDYPLAWSLLTAENQKESPVTRFREEGASFNQLAGKLRRRRLIASTWSKDPPGAPERGVYASFDLAAQYTNIDRQCGSLTLYQPAAGGPFKVLRSENYFLDNRTAQELELSRSRQALLDAWAKISASCRKFSWDPAP